MIVVNVTGAYNLKMAHFVIYFATIKFKNQKLREKKKYIKV